MENKSKIGISFLDLRFRSLRSIGRRMLARFRAFLTARKSATLQGTTTKSPGSHLLANPGKSDVGGIQKRLAEKKVCLDHIESERACHGDSTFGKAAENRIVWGELLDLELQDVDEQVSRVCGLADSVGGGLLRISAQERASLRKGGLHGLGDK